MHLTSREGEGTLAKPSDMELASEMIVLDDILTFLLMKAVTLACNLLQNPVH